MINFLESMEATLTIYFKRKQITVKSTWSAILERFEMNGDQQWSLIFAGMVISDFENINHIDQDFFISKI